MNTFKNLSRKADVYGDFHFISFFASTLARLAYFNDNLFLKKYHSIFGPVFIPKILNAINDVSSDNLNSLLDDQTIFGLTQDPTTDTFANYEYVFKNKRYLDVVKLNMPQNINILNGDLTGSPQYPIQGEQTQDGTVKYISIGWSNYGEIFVVGDKRMPNTILLLFRGTYSAKTAALYSKPTSIVPLTVCKDKNGNPEKFLYGIFKPTTEMIHTIVEAMRYLAVDFLGATQPNSVKIFTTGHSLGGAMCSNFAYLWMGIKQTSPYNASPYDVLASNIICISLGAPRCMGNNVATKFCEFVKQKRILYLRITTRGDPVVALPPKTGTGYQHPCSDDATMREFVNEDCNATLTMRPTPNVSYSSNLDCQNYKTRKYVPNPLSHTIYLHILYTKAVDIMKFVKGIGIAQEVLRDADKSTVCRLVMGTGNEYKAIFFNVNKAREKPTNVDVMEEVDLSKPTPMDLQSNDMPQAGGGFFDLFFKKSEPPVVALKQDEPPPNSTEVSEETITSNSPSSDSLATTGDTNGATTKATTGTTTDATTGDTNGATTKATTGTTTDATTGVTNGATTGINNGATNGVTTEINKTTNNTPSAPRAQSKLFSTKIPSLPSIKIGGEVAEDRRVTLTAFNTLITQMVPLSGDLCPQKGQMATNDIFTNDIMPDLSCPGAQFGGIRRHNHTKKRRHSKRIRKIKRRTIRRTNRIFKNRRTRKL